MTTNTQSAIRTQVDAGYETSKFVLGAGVVMAAFIGLWGAVCLASALVSMGPLNVLKSYLSAIIG